jgi:hypothetical protein
LTGELAAGDAAAYLDTLSEHADLDAAVNWYRAAGAVGLVADRHRFEEVAGAGHFRTDEAPNRSANASSHI